jgi:hypothetical protein
MWRAFTAPPNTPIQILRRLALAVHMPNDLSSSSLDVVPRLVPHTRRHDEPKSPLMSADYSYELFLEAASQLRRIARASGLRARSRLVPFLDSFQVNTDHFASFTLPLAIAFCLDLCELSNKRLYIGV